MKIEETNLLVDKAKTKKDGIYSFKSFKYVVKNGRFILFSDYFGNIYQRVGNFNVFLGKVKERYEIIKELRKLQKEVSNKYY